MVTGLKQKVVKAIKVEHSDDPATSWRGAARRWLSAWRFGWGCGIGWSNGWRRAKGDLIG